MATNGFQEESANLRRSWNHYSHEQLDSYLVSSVEDPRINCQSILTRALIADTLWPDEFTDLIDAELRFGAVLTWLLSQLEDGADRYELLDSIADSGGGSCPQMIRETYQWLQSDGCPVQDYVSLALEPQDPDKPGQLLHDAALDTFSSLWRNTLAGRHAEHISILEPACGSANDYRFIDRHGLSKYVDYTGLDISPRNVDNAKRRFPDTDFLVASILDSDIPDESFDYLFVHDLFEHLSLDALNQALTEVMRIVRREAWLHFFNAGDGEEHLIQPVDRYHWNLLSVRRISETLEQLGADLEVISIPGLIREKFHFDGYYNQEAVTILAKKPR
jgi:SAM-dependent methyltransferase